MGGYLTDPPTVFGAPTARESEHANAPGLWTGAFVLPRGVGQAPELAAGLAPPSFPSRPSPCLCGPRSKRERVTL